MAAHAGIPVLNMPDMLRDPVSALAGREVPVSVLQEQAVSFLHGCQVPYLSRTFISTGFDRQTCETCPWHACRGL